MNNWASIGYKNIITIQWWKNFQALDQAKENVHDKNGESKLRIWSPLRMFESIKTHIAHWDIVSIA